MRFSLQATQLEARAGRQTQTHHRAAEPGEGRLSSSVMPPRLSDPMFHRAHPSSAITGELSRGWAERATNSSGSGREPQLATVWHAPRRPWCAAVETAAAARGATCLSVCENPFATGIYLYGAHHPPFRGPAAAPVACGGASQHMQVSSAVDEPRARSPPQEDNYLITTSSSQWKPRAITDTREEKRGASKSATPVRCAHHTVYRDP